MLRRRIVYIHFLALYYLSIGKISAQTNDSILNRNIQAWQVYASHRKPQLFISIDKKVYAPDDNILFNATIIANGADADTIHTLHVILIDLATRKQVAGDRFPIANGISNGSLFVPDTATAGEYLLMAYTNATKEPASDNIFRQQISIRTSARAPFTQVLTVAPLERPGTDSIRIDGKIITDYGGIAAGGQFNYSLVGDGKLLQTGKRTIDPFGEVHINVLSQTVLPKTLALYSSVRRGQNEQSFWTPVIVNPGQLSIKYYPEGGALVDGHNSRLGLELRRLDGMGVSAIGSLIEDGVVVRTFQTDKMGLGILDFTPRSGRNYSIRLQDAYNGSPVSGQFPPVNTDGCTIRIKNGIVRDSLELNIQAGPSDRDLAIMIHTSQEILYAATVILRSDAGTIKIPATDWPKAVLATITVFAQDGNVVAGRSIYLPPPGSSVTMTADSAVYGERSKVTLHIRLTDEFGKGLKGMFSFSSALASKSRATDLKDLYQTPLPLLDYALKDSAIDRMLLTGLDDPHRWDNILAYANRYPLPDKNNKIPSSEDYGYVLHFDKRPRRPVEMILLGASVYTIKTDSTGAFGIPHDLLLVPAGNNPSLAVLGEHSEETYKVIVKNTYDTLNRALAAAWYSPAALLSDSTAQREAGPLANTNTGFNTPKTLKQAVVTAFHEEEYMGPPGHGPCMDHVCIHGVLNCMYDPTMVKPVLGEMYAVRAYNASRGDFSGPVGPYNIKYRHCMGCKGCEVPTLLNAFKGIHMPKEFFRADSANITPSEPALATTLFWLPTVITDSNGEATIHFYTGDIPGRFVNTIEGITECGLFQAKTVFRVERPAQP